MPAYKLCYFNARGLAEMCRLVFAEAGVSFEDVRYTGEEWSKHKPDMLFNTMPVLFVDGEQIAHSRAALRYLAREYKLEGCNSLTAAKVDMWIEALIEAVMKMPFTEKDEEKKKAMAAEVIKDVIIPRLKKFEENMKGTYLFGEDITAADIAAYVIMDGMKRRGSGEFLEAVPKFKAMMAAVEARPKIAKWIAERPDTEN